MEVRKQPVDDAKAMPGPDEEPRVALARRQRPRYCGGFQGPPVPAGSYLVKLMIGDKVVGQKTIVVEADATFLQ